MFVYASAVPPVPVFRSSSTYSNMLIATLVLFLPALALSLGRGPALDRPLEVQAPPLPLINGLVPDGGYGGFDTNNVPNLVSSPHPLQD
jgi:hypothetical protein